MPEIPQFVIDRGRATSPVFEADEVASWTAGQLDQLISDGVLKSAENARTITCNACGHDHIETVQYIQEPSGSELRAYIWCDEAGRVDVPLSRLRRWAVVTSKLLSRFVTESGRHAARMAEVEWEDSQRRALWAAVEKQDTSAVLEVLARDIAHWAKQIKEELFSFIYDADSADREMCNPLNGSPLRPYPFVRPFIGTAEAIELLEFHKSVDYAGRFAERLNALNDLQSSFADKVCEYGSRFGNDIALERFLELDELRKDLKGRAFNIADHILLVASQLGRVSDSAEEVKQPARRGNRKRDEVVPKRSWTQTDLDDAIQQYKAQRSSNYSDLVANVKQGKAGAKKSARAMFGRNAIVRALGVKAPAMVSRSPAWHEIADDLGLRDQTATQSLAGRRKVGLGMALEEQAEATPVAVVDDVIRRETVSLIRSSMGSAEADATIEKLERGDLTDDAAREIAGLSSQQQHDAKGRKAR